MKRQPVDCKPVVSRSRGYIAVMVLIVVAIMSGLSYAMIRSTLSMSAVQRNQLQGWEAQQAARLGIEHALEKMESPSWSGPDSDYDILLSDQTGFHVAYHYEDSLQPEDEDFWQQPYRVNVTVIGYSSNGPHKTCYQITTNVILDEVQLNPYRDAFATNVPTRTVTVADRGQAAREAAPDFIDFGNRIEGTLHSTKGVSLWDSIEADHRVDFLGDMTLPAWSELAPLTDRCDVEDSSVYSSFADAISILSLGLYQVPSVNKGLKYTPAAETYQIYRGGPTYTIPQLYGTVTNLEVSPVAANPWGLVRGISELRLGPGCLIDGCISMEQGSDLFLEDKEVNVRAGVRVLPDGTTFELPAILANRCVVEAKEAIAVQGTTISDYGFQTNPQSETAQFILKGRVYCDYLSLATFKPETNNTASQDPTDLEDYVDRCHFSNVPLATIQDLAPQRLHWQSTLAPFLVPKDGLTEGYRWAILSTVEEGFQ